MTTSFYSLEDAGAANGARAYDVKHPNGRFAGVVVARADGTFRHYYNCTATKGSTRKLTCWSGVFASIDARMKRLAAKRGA